MTNEQKDALRALLNDIESMEEAPAHYGAFGEFIVGDDGATVQWPNLDLSTARVKAAFGADLVP